jgi:hypothetical protein
MIRAIAYDKCHNTNIGYVDAKKIVVGNGLTGLDGILRDVESITETEHRGKDTITITCDDGYQLVMPDRGIDKEFEFK